MLVLVAGNVEARTGRTVGLAGIGIADVDPCIATDVCGGGRMCGGRGETLRLAAMPLLVRCNGGGGTASKAGEGALG